MTPLTLRHSPHARGRPSPSACSGTAACRVAGTLAANRVTAVSAITRPLRRSPRSEPPEEASGIRTATAVRCRGQPPAQTPKPTSARVQPATEASAGETADLPPTPRRRTPTSPVTTEVSIDFTPSRARGIRAETLPRKREDSFRYSEGQPRNGDGDDAAIVVIFLIKRYIYVWIYGNTLEEDVRKNFGESLGGRTGRRIVSDLDAGFFSVTSWEPGPELCFCVLFVAPYAHMPSSELALSESCLRLGWLGGYL